MNDDEYFLSQTPSERFHRGLQFVGYAAMVRKAYAELRASRQGEFQLEEPFLNLSNNLGLAERQLRALRKREVWRADRTPNSKGPLRGEHMHEIPPRPVGFEFPGGPTPPGQLRRHIAECP